MCVCERERDVSVRCVCVVVVVVAADNITKAHKQGRSCCSCGSPIVVVSRLV